MADDRSHNNVKCKKAQFELSFVKFNPDFFFIIYCSGISSRNKIRKKGENFYCSH